MFSYECLSALFQICGFTKHNLFYLLLALILSEAFEGHFFEWLQLYITLRYFNFHNVTEDTNERQKVVSSFCQVIAK